MCLLDKCLPSQIWDKVSNSNIKRKDDECYKSESSKDTCVGRFFLEVENVRVFT